MEAAVSVCGRAAWKKRTTYEYQAPGRVQTTLYDLVAAVGDAVGNEDSDRVADVVSQLLLTAGARDLFTGADVRVGIDSLTSCQNIDVSWLSA